MGRNNEYYAVASSPYLAKAVIYSSWGKAHPLVTFVNSRHEAFRSLEGAKDYMRELDIPYDLDIASTTEDTTPERGSQAFYAVADGIKPGIYPYYNGPVGARPKVEKHKGACFKVFKNKMQAEAFIED